MLAGDAARAHAAYWKDELSGELPVLDFPTDYPRADATPYAADTLQIKLPSDLTRQLRELARRSGVSLFMLLLGLYQVLLQRHTGQADFIIGTPVAGRPQPRFHETIGYFINMMPLRSHVDPRQSFAAHLEHLRWVVMRGIEHAVYPFPRMVTDLGRQARHGMDPVFQTTFELQNFVPSHSEDAFAGTGGDIAFLDDIVQEGDFELSVQMLERADTLVFKVSYNPTLYEPARMRHFASHYQQLAQSVAADPHQAIAEYLILDEQEQHTVLMAFNATAAPYPHDRCIHQLFEAQAGKTPHAIAAIYDGQQLSYSELDGRANQLAHHLRHLGVGAESLVALCAERSFEMVIGLLAILKAGGAYVPIDPEYPADRIAFMLEDAQASMLLTQHRLAERLPAMLPVLCLDSDARQWHDTPATAPVCTVTPRHLAYVMYTSGSTGKPKGAMNEHRGVVNRLSWIQRIYPLDANDRMLQKASLSFDDSVSEVLWPLTAGASLVLAQPGGHRDHAYLAELIQRERISTMHVVPSMLEAFIETPGLADCTHLKRVLSGGEALSSALSQRFLQRLPTVELHNLYGPTECAIDMTAWACCGATSSEQVPVGRPMANTRMYILDARGQPAPIGVAGELVLAGAQVGRGYLRRPSLTAERFVPDPFSPEPGARMYQTGDLARWRPDGNVDYLGRNDFQVKLRGFRIELGEIESRLCAHPTVREAVVLAREDLAGEKRLVAYVVPREAPSPPSAEALRAHLQAALPEYMIPAAFVVLEVLPITANGKLDRQALPAPDMSARAAAAYEPPQGPVEEALALIWQELLGLERVGRHDDFFALGGHSLMAIRLMVQIEATMQAGLAFSSLYRNATVAGLAQQIAHVALPGAGTVESGSLLDPDTLVPIQPHGAKRPLFCFPGSGGSALYLRDLGLGLDPERPFYGLQPRGLDGMTAPRARIEDIAADHLQVIRQLQEKGPYLLAGHSFGAHVAYEVASQLQAQGQDIAGVLILDAAAPVATQDSAPLDKEFVLREAVMYLEMMTKRSMGLNLQALASLDPEEQIKALHAAAVRAQWLPQGSSPKVLRGFLNVYSANQAMAYVAKAGPRFPLVVYRASELTPGQQRLSEPVESDWGWSGLMESFLPVIAVPGNHFTMLAAPHVPTLAALMHECIAVLEAQYQQRVSPLSRPHKKAPSRHRSAKKAPAHKVRA
jgi:amino acid adenylation domain-containing protein